MLVLGVSPPFSAPSFLLVVDSTPVGLRRPHPRPPYSLHWHSWIIGTRRLSFGRLRHEWRCMYAVQVELAPCSYLLSWPLASTFIPYLIPHGGCHC